MADKKTPGIPCHPNRTAFDGAVEEAPNSKLPKKYISVAEACQRYGIGQTRFRELLHLNQIEAVRFGIRVLVNVESADTFFSRLPRY